MARMNFTGNVIHDAGLLVETCRERLRQGDKPADDKAARYEAERAAWQSWAERGKPQDDPAVHVALVVADTSSPRFKWFTPGAATG